MARLAVPAQGDTKPSPPQNTPQEFQYSFPRRGLLHRWPCKPCTVVRNDDK